MTERVTFTAVDLDQQVILGVYDSQDEAVERVHREGESIPLAPGQLRELGVVIQSEGREPCLLPMTVAHDA